LQDFASFFFHRAAVSSGPDAKATHDLGTVPSRGAAEAARDLVA